MKSTYYISSGRLNRMYTLRFEEPRWARDENGKAYAEGFYDSYVCNLAHDLDAARGKARERVGFAPEVRADSSLDDIAAPSERNPETIYFGKHDGAHYSVMDEDYAVFVYNHMSRAVFPEFWENVYNHFKDAIDAEEARLNAEKRAAERAERKRVKAIRNTAWVGAVGGDRIKVVGTVTACFGFDGSFGWTTITKVTDDDGNHYLYWNSLNGREYSAVEGDRVEFMAGVKDHAYDRDEPEMKVTVLSRATKVKVTTCEVA